MAVRPDGRAIVAFELGFRADLGFGPLLAPAGAFGLVLGAWDPDGDRAFGWTDPMLQVRASSIALLADGGVLVGGEASDAYLGDLGPRSLRFSTEGGLVWMTTTPATLVTARSEAEAVATDVGASGVRVHGIALDSGAETFSLPLALPDATSPVSIAQRPDGHVEIAASQQLPAQGDEVGEVDAWLVRVDGTTGENLARSFGGPGNQRITDARVDPAGHVVVAGSADPAIDFGEAGVVEGPIDVPFVARLAE
jgi:hypothetical protein